LNPGDTPSANATHKNKPRLQKPVRGGETDGEAGAEGGRVETTSRPLGTDYRFQEGRNTKEKKQSRSRNGMEARDHAAGGIGGHVVSLHGDLKRSNGSRA